MDLSPNAVASRLALDLKINEQLRILRTCAFKTKLSGTPAQLAEDIQAGKLKAKNVYLLGDRWAVKYFFAGKQRTFGFFGCGEYDSAYRLADMIIRRFADLRVKAFRLTEESYNLTPSQAEADTNLEHDINSVLITLHSLSPEKKYKDCVPQVRKTARGEFVKMLAHLDRLEATLLDQSKRIEVLIEILRPKEDLQKFEGSEKVIPESCFQIDALGATVSHNES